MGIAIPSDIVSSSDANAIVSNVINKLLSDYHASSGTVFVSIRAENGQILVQGQLPSSLTRNQNNYEIFTDLCFCVQWQFDRLVVKSIENVLVFVCCSC